MKTQLIVSIISLLFSVCLLACAIKLCRDQFLSVKKARKLFKDKHGYLPMLFLLLVFLTSCGTAHYCPTYSSHSYNSHYKYK